MEEVGENPARAKRLPDGVMEKWHCLCTHYLFWRRLVTFRRFTDRHGTDWEVWEVIPPRAERRRSERRTLPDRRMTLREGTRDRRIRARRTKASPDYVRISPGFEHGWLCFTSGPAVRRLAPIPSDWIHVESDQLEIWVNVASPSWKRSPTNQARNSG
jgi:hypothetical protein